MIKQLIKNISSSALNYVVMYGLKFVLRVVFVKTLPIEYLGINSLLTNIIAVLSLVEMGIGPAITYSLYKPLAYNNKYAVKAIMNLFKKVYSIIGILLLLIGLAAYNFLDIFISDFNKIPELRYFYLAFLINSVLSYFLSYKRNILIADQKQYIVNNYNTCIQTVVIILQTILLFIFKNYWYFLLVMIAGTVIENLTLTQRSNKDYKFLNDNTIGIKLPTEIKSEIIKNIKAMLCHKIGNVFITSSSNLILAKFMDLITIGLYSNYYMIVSSINVLTGKILEAFLAVIGNFIITAEDKNKLRAFKTIEFITAWQASVVFVGLYGLFDKFIILWLGKEFVLDRAISILLAFYVYIEYMRYAVLIFKDASGLYWQDRYKTLIQSVINILASIFFIQNYGLNGVVVSLIISNLLTSFWIEPYILLKNTINIPIKEYFLDYFKFTVLTVAIAIMTEMVNNYIFTDVTVINFIINVFICIFLTTIAWLLIFFNRDEISEIKKLLKNKFKDM